MLSRVMPALLTRMSIPDRGDARHAPPGGIVAHVELVDGMPVSPGTGAAVSLPAAAPHGAFVLEGDGDGVADAARTR
jgi:hypothetical protein